MPKIKEPEIIKMNRFANESNGVLTVETDAKTNNRVLYCQVCYCNVNSDKKQHVDQHLNTGQHMAKLKEFKTKQLSVQTMFQKTNKDFKSDLCEFLVTCNIPFDRLNKPGFKKFFQKYVKFDLPDESSLRKSYLEPLYKQTIDRIRTDLQNQYIWVQIDETEDLKKKKVVNTIIGSLNVDQIQCEKHLIDVRFVERANHSTIIQSVTHALTILWPEGIKFDKFLVLITDAAPYMRLAGEGLKLIYPKLLHITCVAHGLHNLSQYLMSDYKNVNRFVVCAKKIFLKSPNRVDLFREVLPNTPLPPEPVKTRWGSWLRAVRYFAENYDMFCEVIDKLDSEDSAFIEEIKKIIANTDLKNEISFIFANFDCIHEAITKLSSSGLSLKESISIIESVRKQLEDSLSGTYEGILIKMRKIFDKNKGLKSLQLINQVLNGKTNLKLDCDLSPSEMAALKWCPITDCDIERSFSQYKLILTERRLRFDEENLKQYLIIYCNSE